MTFIYGLVDPGSGRFRYVGKADDPRRRLRRHLKEARAGSDTHCHRWIALLLAEGQRPGLVVLDQAGEGEWQIAERAWIEWLRSAGHPLTNLTLGGEGLSMTPALRPRLVSANLRRSEGRLYRDRDWLEREYVQRRRPASALAREAGTTHAVITSWLRRYGLPVRSRGDSNSGVQRPASVQAMEEARDRRARARAPGLALLKDRAWLSERIAGGLSGRAIAREARCSKQSVYRAIARHGLDRPIAAFRSYV